MRALGIMVDQEVNLTPLLPGTSALKSRWIKRFGVCACADVEHSAAANPIEAIHFASMPSVPSGDAEVWHVCGWLR
jgi:hypothetical protein